VLTYSYSITFINDFINLDFVKLTNVYYNFNYFVNLAYNILAYNILNVTSVGTTNVTSSVTVNPNHIENTLAPNIESIADKRYVKNDNPIFKYDFKAGTYFPESYTTNFTHMLASIDQAFGGFKKAE
jgi:hypothetical protein